MNHSTSTLVGKPALGDIVAPLAVIAALLTAVLAFTAEQAIASHVSCGAIITTDTRLDRDLVGCQGDGLVIGAAGITLDLNGHTVSGTGGGTGIDDSAGHDRVRIINGTVTSFSNGIVLIGASSSRLTGLTVTDNASGGISLVDGSDANRVERNVVSGNRLDGIFLFASDNNMIAQNSVTGNDPAGISLVEGSDDNRVQRNRLSHNTIGIAVGVSQRNKIEHNSLSGNAIIGIVLDQSHDSVIKKNSVSRSELYGILLAASNDNRISKNTAAANGIDGILVENGSTGTELKRNTANHNGDDGIDVSDPTSILTGNVADHNADLGIDAVAGVTDRGANRASANGDPAQCVNVTCS